MIAHRFEVVVIGGGHAGVEAAWAAANLLDEPRSVALVTLDPTRIGVMSCNPAIGGLAKGQLVREIDALGGLMGLATDATGIQFRVLNTSKGQAVHGPRAQCDKHAYAQAVQMLIASRRQIEVIAGSVERLFVESDTVTGVVVRTAAGEDWKLGAGAVVLTTGTFMRGLMHTGEQQTRGGRFGEAPAVGISAALRDLGFELGRLKTGTPPRLKRSTIRWEDLPPQYGDVPPKPFSDLTPRASDGSTAPAAAVRNGDSAAAVDRALESWQSAGFIASPFPPLGQVECRQTSTTPRAHDLIRANLHRAPMYSGQIEAAGPRYCPSIEDKVVRFAQRPSHGVFLEPESHRDDWVYCNGISTSLPTDVQDALVRSMPGCEAAHIYRYGYAVEYDMVRPHQITVTGRTRLVDRLFLAGQINGTSGYEEAAAQGIVAGINAALAVLGRDELVIGRDQAYIGVLMDDLVTRMPVEPYRMFTSRAEHRLLLRADNSADRLTPVARGLGLLGTTDLGRKRLAQFASRQRQITALHALIETARHEGSAVSRLIRTQNFELENLRRVVGSTGIGSDLPDSVLETVYADRRYEAYLARQRAEIRRHADLEHRRLPDTWPDSMLDGLRAEARQALLRFRPQTFGQASRLEGITPADMTLLAVLVKRHGRDRGEPQRAGSSESL